MEPKIIIINKPIPESIKKAIEDKKIWMEKIRSGEITFDLTKAIRII